jgi:hypothetical protein
MSWEPPEEKIHFSVKAMHGVVGMMYVIGIDIKRAVDVFDAALFGSYGKYFVRDQKKALCRDLAINILDNLSFQKMAGVGIDDVRENGYLDSIAESLGKKPEDVTLEVLRELAEEE